MTNRLKKQQIEGRALIFSLMTALFWFGNKVFLTADFPYEGRIVQGSELCLLNDVEET